MEKIYKVELHYSSAHKQVRYLSTEEKADAVIGEFEKKHPYNIARKFIITVE
jgi:hypothetical protein